MIVNYPGSDSYFTTQIIGTETKLDGTYDGWCVDTDRVIYANTSYTVNVYSSYEALPVGLVEHPENFPKVNWIINQNYVGKSITKRWYLYIW